MERRDPELTPEYVAALRRLTPQQKLRAVENLYWTARKLKAAGLRLQHPEWSEERIQETVRTMFLHARD